MKNMNTPADVVQVSPNVYSTQESQAAVRMLALAEEVLAPAAVATALEAMQASLRLRW